MPELSSAPRRPASRLSLRHDREADVAVNATTPANSIAARTITATWADHVATRNAARSGDAMNRASVSTAWIAYAAWSVDPGTRSRHSARRLDIKGAGAAPATTAITTSAQVGAP